VADDGSAPVTEDAQALRDAVDRALDDLLGPPPTELVEEQHEPRDPSSENEAMAHMYRAPFRLYGLG
jgi:hypothetical protein